jgi:hypothetical protein
LGVDLTLCQTNLPGGRVCIPGSSRSRTLGGTGIL